MGFIQKDALRTMLISYLGLVLGYVNKGLLFIIFLTTDQIGLVNLIVAVGLLFAQFANLGSIYAVWRFFPFFRNEAKNNYGFLTMMIGTVLVGIALCTAATIFLQDTISHYYSVKSKEFVTYYYWIIPVGIAHVFFLLFENYLRSMYKNILSVFVYEFLFRILIALLILLYAFSWINFELFLIIHSVLYLVPTLILAIYLIQIKELSFNFKNIEIPKRFKKIILSFSLFSYVNSLGTLLVTTIDAMMIASMIGLEATGVYTTVIYLASALQVPYKSLMRVSSPLIPHYWKERNYTEMAALYTRVSSISLIMALSMFSVIWINHEVIRSFLESTRPEFVPGIYVFLFLMIGRVLDMYFGLNGIIFITSKKYKYDLIFTISLLAIVIVLNLWLIPLYGMAGAAISTGIAFVVYNVGRLYFIWKAYKLHPFTFQQVKVLVLFALNMLFFGFKPVYFDSFILEIVMNCIFFGILFLVPVYVLKLEPEINMYVRKVLGVLRSKIG